MVSGARDAQVDPLATPPTDGGARALEGHTTTTGGVWRMTTRDAARSFTCPRCHAAPGELCIGLRGKPRQAAHWQRHAAAIEGGAKVIKTIDPYGRRDDASGHPGTSG